MSLPRIFPRLPAHVKPVPSALEVNEPWGESQSLPAPPPAPAHLLFPRASLHLGLWDDSGTAFSAAQPHVLSTSSSALLSPQGLPAPSSAQPTPTSPTWALHTGQSPHLVTQLLPLPSRAVGPCRRVLGGGLLHLCTLPGT